MTKTVYFLILLIFASCDERNTKVEKSGSTIEECISMKREYDAFGLLRKWKQTWNTKYKRCDREIIPLTYFEKSQRKRNKNNIQCEPQYFIPKEVFLEAANNFYTYRDSKYFLNLDPTTGEYKRIILGKNKDGEPSFSREIGCFYIREDLENEPWGDVDYGIQLYLEQPLSASSNISKRNEIFRITKMDTDWHLTSFDSTNDWSYKFCPTSSVDWNFCTLLKNGNIMFYSSLTDTQKDNLLTEALLIRTQYNFIETDQEKFQSMWNNINDTHKEEPEINFKYKVTFTPDGPYFTEAAWIDYIKHERPVMPDTSIIEQRPVCYKGYNRIILNNGNTSLIKGEICYIDGEYDFIEY